MYLLLRLGGLAVILTLLAGVAMFVLPFALIGCLAYGLYLLARPGGGLDQFQARRRAIGSWCPQCNDWHPNGQHMPQGW